MIDWGAMRSTFSSQGWDGKVKIVRLGIILVGKRWLILTNVAKLHCAKVDAILDIVW